MNKSLHVLEATKKDDEYYLLGVEPSLLASVHSMVTIKRIPFFLAAIIEELIEK
jgi:hypothetical protein